MHLRNCTRRLTVDPYRPTGWLARAQILLKLRYPELAAGDAYKALLLAEKQERTSSRTTVDFPADVKCRFTTSGAEEALQEFTATSSEFVESQMTRISDNAKYGAVLLLSRALFFANSFYECLNAISRHFRFFAQDESLFRLWRLAKSAADYEERNRHKDDDFVLMDFVEQEEQRQSGDIKMQAYPWMSAWIFCRAPNTLWSINQELLTASNSCEAKRSRICGSATVEEPSTTSMDIFGIFAPSEVIKDQELPIGRTSLCANHNMSTCCAVCCSMLPLIRAGCPQCKKKYSTKECSTKAACVRPLNCGNDIFFPDGTGERRRSKTQARQAAENLLFRLLAAAVKYTLRTPVHPLQVPFLNQSTAVCGTEEPRRFSLEINIVSPIKMLRSLGVDVFTNHDFDTWVLQTIQARLDANCRAYESSSDGRYIIAIPPLFSFFNQSCEPNITVEIDVAKETSSLTAVASRGVGKGEEIVRQLY